MTTTGPSPGLQVNQSAATPFPVKTFTPTGFWGPARPEVHVLGKTTHVILIVSLCHSKVMDRPFTHLRSQVHRVISCLAHTMGRSPKAQLY